MITVYGSISIILLCTFLPPMLDRYFKNVENIKKGRRHTAYGIMAIILVVMPIFIDNLYAIYFFSIAAVVSAALIANVTFLGTSFVLILSTVILPSLVIYDIAAGNKVNNPIQMILGHLDWEKFLLPFFLGIITLFAVRFISRNITSRFEKG